MLYGVRVYLLNKCVKCVIEPWMMVMTPLPPVPYIVHPSIRSVYKQHQLFQIICFFFLKKNIFVCLFVSVFQLIYSIVWVLFIIRSRSITIPLYIHLSLAPYVFVCCSPHFSAHLTFHLHSMILRRRKKVTTATWRTIRHYDMIWYGT